MEIILEEQFTKEQECLLEMHSVLNVLNVVTYELLLLQDILAAAGDLDQLIEQNARMGEQLRDQQRAFSLVTNVAQYITGVRTVLTDCAAAAGLADDSKFLQHMANIQSIFAILEVRAAEIVARLKAEDPWTLFNIQDLKQNFFNLFRAIERNSHGGYRIVHNLAEHNEGDYFVSLEISGEHEDVIWMPDVFQDVMRDLLANSRKYTPPGGKITAGLCQLHDSLRFVVIDNGMGIPPDEIQNVVKFGHRGSNTSGRTTRGGGFGLTKAFYVARKFNGRMWVYSTGVPGEGTRIEIRLPVPVSVYLKR